MTQPIEPFRLPKQGAFESTHDWLERGFSEFLRHQSAALASPQPAQEAEPMRELLAKIIDHWGYPEAAERIAEGPLDAVDRAALRELRTGIADLVKPVEGRKIHAASGGLIDSHQLARIEARGLRIIKEPNL